MQGYNIGYKVTKRRRVTGASVLNKIKYSKLRMIGAGANGIVVTDEYYAIKIGYVDSSDADWLNKAAAYGFAVPVVYCESNSKIDRRLAAFIRNNPAKRNGNAVDVDDYINSDDYADIMVSLLVQPFMDNDCFVPINSEARVDGYTIAWEVKKQVERITALHWSDAHPWNLGIYRGALIIIDR